jgi:hypothetical protein
MLLHSFTIGEHVLEAFQSTQLIVYLAVKIKAGPDRPPRLAGALVMTKRPQLASPSGRVALGPTTCL